jgi:hypothetical protein
MQPLECIIHCLNRAIELEAGRLVQEFIGSAEDRIRETPDTGERQMERLVRKGWIHDRCGHSCECLTLRFLIRVCVAQVELDIQLTYRLVGAIVAHRIDHLMEA